MRTGSFQIADSSVHSIKVWTPEKLLLSPAVHCI